MIDDELHFALWKHYQGHCLHCRIEKGKAFHHIVPVSNGGEDCPENLVLLCSDCHDWAHRIGTKESAKILKEEMSYYANRTQ